MCDSERDRGGGKFCDVTSVTTSYVTQRTAGNRAVITSTTGKLGKMCFMMITLL